MSLVFLSEFEKQVTTYHNAGQLQVAALPESLLSIGVNCFYDNKALTSVSIGSRIESIGQYAFCRCPALRYVTFAPSSTPLLAIDKGAFSLNDSLSSVTLSGGLKSVASGAFASTPLLRKLTIPAIVTEVGNNVFSTMGSLREVTFAGLPPSNLANAGLAKNVKIRYSSEWAEDWEAVVESCGFTNVSAYEGTGGGGTVAGEGLVLTVTNVVVHYVTNSKIASSVTPDTTSGLVNIVAAVEAEKAIAVSPEWAAQYPEFKTAFGDDFGAALTSPSGKKDGAGNAMFVWQDYVAGTDPTKLDDVFMASITFDEAGTPVISWTPELAPAEAAKRIYRKFGKVRLSDPTWTEISDSETKNYNFFKVTVGIR